ncbi:MAG: hypothetical protein HOI95_06530 [Chromatiales bacterium]|nr:hypothetical protein [Chromatiales bacterium]
MNNALGRFAFAVNKVLMSVSKGLFAYQSFMVFRPNPSLRILLQNATDASAERAQAMDHP